MDEEEDEERRKRWQATSLRPCQVEHLRLVRVGIHPNRGGLRDDQFGQRDRHTPGVVLAVVDGRILIAGAYITLFHLSAQHKRFLWKKGAVGVFM